jgi:hypothetical protein
MALILILTVALLVLPLIDIAAGPTPNVERVRMQKIIVILVTLVILVIILFFPDALVLPFPHTWHSSAPGRAT